MNKELYSDIVAELTNFEHPDEDTEMTDAAWVDVFYDLLRRVQNEVDIENEIEREENKMFTKSDLRNGDVCIRRDGQRRVYIVTDNFKILTGFDYQTEGWLYLQDYNEDLTSKRVLDFKEKDIMKVFRPKEGRSLSYYKTDNLVENGFELVFERKPEPVEMTLAEVCKALGKEIKIVKEH